MPDDGNAIVRLHGDGNMPVGTVAAFLAALEEAYSGAFLFLHALDDLEKWHSPGPPPFLLSPYGLRPGRARSGRFSRQQIIAGELDLSDQLPASRRLILRAVRLTSPGWWEVIGQLNPLEVLRQFLNDQHERKKDTAYRNSAERDRLNYENELLRTRIIKERLDIARALGATATDLAPLWNPLLIRPFKSLEDFQDRGVISTGDLREPHQPPD